MTSFSAQVDVWVKKTIKRQEAVFKMSTQELIKIAQTPVASGGNMPVDTGFLRASGMAGLNSPISRGGNHGAATTFTFDLGQTALVISKAKMGDSIYFTYSANYARHVHDGANGRAGRPWITLAAQQWPQIVNKVVLQAKARVN